MYSVELKEGKLYLDELDLTLVPEDLNGSWQRRCEEHERLRATVIENTSSRQ